MTKDRAGLISWFSATQQIRACRDLVFLQFAGLGIEHEFAVAGEYDLLAFVVSNDFQSRKLDYTLFFAYDFVVFDMTRGATAEYGT